jgi:regulator of protease activity HflC (stomatin/prohibitin superfamily)
MESALYIVPVLIIVVVFLSTAIKVLREYERAVVFRLGRLMPPRAPASSC